MERRLVVHGDVRKGDMFIDLEQYLRMPSHADKESAPLGLADETPLASTAPREEAAKGRGESDA